MSILAKHWYGLDILGAQTIPTVAPAKGYTDRTTVLAVQNALLDSGYKLKYGADGAWGSDTASAVSAFQKAHGISATGVIDNNTLVALGVPAPSRTEAGVSASAAHQDVQRTAADPAAEARKADEDARKAREADQQAAIAAAAKKAADDAAAADTAAQVKAAADAAAKAAASAPPAPPAVQKQVKEAQAKAAVAKTPDEIKDAKKDVQAAAGAVANAATPNFFKREAFAGIPWWGVFAGGAGVLAVGAGVVLAVRK